MRLSNFIDKVLKYSKPPSPVVLPRRVWGFFRGGQEARRSQLWVLGGHANIDSFANGIQEVVPVGMA